MAKKTTSNSNSPKSQGFQKIASFFGNRQTQILFGAFLAFFAIFLLTSFVSYFFSWEQDQSQLSQFSNKDVTVKNLLGKLGASLSDLLIYKGFGISAINLPILLFFSGTSIFLKGSLKKMRKYWGWGILGMLWISISLGFLADKNALLAGVVGYELNIYLQQFLGKTGLILSLAFLLLCYLVIRFKLTPEKVQESITSKVMNDPIMKEENEKTPNTIDEKVVPVSVPSSNKEEKIAIEFPIKPVSKPIITEPDKELDFKVVTAKPSEDDLEIAVEKIVEENQVEENLSDQLVKDFGEFDPTLELGNYKFPTLNLLRDYNESISVDQEELEANKNRIVETLNNYNIGI